MSTRSITLSMSTSAAPQEATEREITDKTPLRLPAGAWAALFTTAALAGGAWIAVRGEVTRQGAAIEANRIEAQKSIAELRTETKEQLGKLNEEQKGQRDLLIRIDENVKRIPR